MAIDNTFWAFVALVIFLGVVVYYKAPALLGKSLDARAARIRADLEEARASKEEAKRQLAEYGRRRREAETEAAEIVAAARREAAALLEEARQKTGDYVTRRTAMAETKIAQAEQDAVAEVRTTAVAIAIAAAEKIIADRNAGGESGAFIDQSIDEVRRRLN